MSPDFRPALDEGKPQKPGRSREEKEHALMPFYPVGLDALQLEADVVTGHRVDLEDRSLSVVRATLGQNIFQGDAASQVQMRLQMSMDKREQSHARALGNHARY
jgi:hypothetical protein